MKKETRILYAGRHSEAHQGAVNPPVYHVSTVTFPTLAALEEAAQRSFDTLYYGRYGTPTSFAFEEAVAALEGGGRAITYPSGLAAVAGVLVGLLEAGDHVLMVDTVYDPTRRFCDRHLAPFGVTTTYYDPLIGAGIAALIRPETKVVFVESPGSLTFEVQDIPAIAAAAHARGALVVMDNTWSAGFFFQPFAHGVDISIQAATKFIVGHSDAMLGTATVRDAGLFERLKRAAITYGYCAGPDDCYLGLRGLRTLAPRLARHQESGLRLARWLAARPEVAQVRHPALPDCPGHPHWKRDFTGACGLFGVVFKDYPRHAMAAFLDGLELFAMGYSWGGYESLVVPMSPEKTRTATRWPHAGPCIRIHTGLEDPDDLILDLEAGLGRLTAAAGSPM